LPTHVRVRAFLENGAKRRVPITYQELAKALQILPPHSIHRVTEALERLMEEDAGADRPFIAASSLAGAVRATTNNEDICSPKLNPTPTRGPAAADCPDPQQS
jgi:hypothetical protein